MKIKIDYSPEVKSGKIVIGSPGDIAIYTRKHFWNRWKATPERFADIKFARLSAKQLRDNIKQLPEYY